MPLKQIGPLSFNTDDVISESSTKNTVVFKGTKDNCRTKIAVKRVIDCITSCEQLRRLSEEKQHDHVIRYFFDVQEGPFRYIALEWCLGTLEDLVERTDFDRGGLTNIEIVRQILSGLDHVHRCEIFHLDLKPTNVLVTRENERRNRVVISDFDISRRSEGGKSLTTSTLSGTEGWFAPEVSLIEDRYRYSSKVDLFAAGCLTYYTLTEGSHPFDEEQNFKSFVCQKNIGLYKKGEYTVTLKGLDRSKQTDQQAVDLIFQLLAVQPKQRPSTSTCLAHPVFWNLSKQKEFVQTAGDILYSKTDNGFIELCERLNKDAGTVIGEQWHVDEKLEVLAADKGYDTRHVDQLLRFVRDYYAHLWEWRMQGKIGASSVDLLEDVNPRYPGFILHVYHCAVPWRREEKLMGFYPKDDSFIKNWDADPRHRTELVNDMHCVWEPATQLSIINDEDERDFRGVSIDSEGRLVITESVSHNVYVLVGGRLNPLFDAALLDRPIDIAIDFKGNMAVADASKNAVLVFDKRGKLSTSITHVDNKDLSQPNGVAFSSSGKLFICDTRNHRVLILIWNNKNKLVFESTFGTRGKRAHQLSFPWMLAVDEHDLVFISDAGNHRIQVFTAQGRHCRTIGEKGTGHLKFIEPTGIALFGNCIFVTDLKNKRVQVTTKTGKYVGCFGPQTETSSIAFTHVWGVDSKKFGERTKFYVADKSRIVELTLNVRKSTRKIAVCQEEPDEDNNE